MTTALDSSLTGTNHNSLLSVATNQFASFCIDNRKKQGTMIVSVKVAKSEIKTLFFSYILILCYTKQIDSMPVSVRLFSNRRQRPSKCGKNNSDFFVLTTF